MPTPAFDVIVCGSLHLDIMVYAPNLPRPDETTVGTRWAMQCGGKGGNQAVMAARAGARTAMIGRVGADDFGARLRANLLAARVDAQAVRIDPVAGSGMSSAIVREDGEYGAVIVSGANLHIAPSTAAEAWRAIGGASVLVLQNEIPEAANLAASQAAHADGATVILNAAPARSLPAALGERIDILVVNRIEAEMMSQVSVQDEAGASAALARLGGIYPNVIVTLGGEGLLVKSAAGAVARIAPKKVAVVSAHGAGDCFVGSLAAKLARGGSLVDAAEFANAAAAAHVSGHGAPGGGVTDAAP